MSPTQQLHHYAAAKAALLKALEHTKPLHTGRMALAMEYRIMQALHLAEDGCEKARRLAQEENRKHTYEYQLEKSIGAREEE